MIGRACRLVAGAAIAWPVIVALTAPELSLLVSTLAVALAAITLWRPGVGLVVLAGLAPAGALLAPTPARTAELLAWATLAGWLLALWRPLAPKGWSRPAMAALLFGACVASSWLGLMVADAAGVAPGWLPVFLWRLVPDDHLLFSTPAPESTAMLQAMAGIGILLAAVATAGAEPSWRRALAPVLLVSLAVLAAATWVQVWREWSANGYSSWLIDRFVFDLAASRFSVHLRDNNAAGSLYAFATSAGLVLAWLDHRRRWLWSGVTVVLLPAFWVTGSRTAILATAATVVMMAVARRTRAWTPRRVRQVALTTVAALVLAAVTVWLWRQDDGVGSAADAVNMRWQFTETSARMFASAPVFGVGIGRYHGRSAEFMPEALRAVYPNENAHNYFAQTFAELGLTGGALFSWLVLAGLAMAWRHHVRSDATPAALLAGCTAYALTCVTGHPLLVSEAALPFWVAFGALVSGLPWPASRTRPRWLAGTVCLVLAAGLLSSVRTYVRGDTRPPARGFYERDTAEDGTSFMWATRHVTTYGRPTPGFIRLVLRAPEVPTRRPFVVETWLGGHVVDRVELPPDRWLVREIPVRSAATTLVRRIDVRVNQAWTRPSENRNAPETPALAIMAAEIRWAGPGSR